MFSYLKCPTPPPILSRLLPGLFLLLGLLSLLAACGSSGGGGGGGGNSTATWRITLENQHTTQLTLQVDEATAAAVPASASGFDGTNTFTLAAGATSVFSIDCGVAFTIIAIGGDTSLAANIPLPQNCSNGGNTARVPFGAAGITWALELHNSTLVELTLQVSDATETAFTGTPGSYNADTNRFTLAAGGSATANLPCGVNFAIVAGGTATNPAAEIEHPQNCTEHGQRIPLAFTSPTWELTLENQHTAQLTLQVDEATAAAVPATASGFDGTDTFRLAAGATSVFSINCGGAFAIIAIGGDTSLAANIPLPQNCSHGSHTARVPFGAAGITWAVELHNSTLVELTLQVSDATETAFTGTPGSYNADTNRFTLAAGGSATANLPCGVNFAIVAGGTATNPAAEIEPPQNCTEHGQRIPLAFTSPTWELTLENQHTAQLTLQVDEATAAAVPATASGFDRTNTFRLAANTTSVFSLNCGVAFAISAIGGDTSLTGNIPSPQNCSAGGSTARVLFNATGLVPTWAVELRNPTAVELTLQVSDATETALAGAPGGYNADTNRFTLAAGSSATANLPCGVNFALVAGGIATNLPESILPPSDCTNGGTSLSLALTRHFIQSSALTAMGSAGDASSHTYTATEDGRVFAYTSGATGEVQLQVTGPNSLDTSDDGQLGVGANAALAFDATASETYTLSLTNASAAAQANLRLHARPAAPLTTAVHAISLSANHSCFLLADAAYCVGHNQVGRLGGGDVATPVNDTVILLRPVFALRHRTTALSAGWHHTCAIVGGTAAAPNGSAWCWGYGLRGRLGDGTSQGYSNIPVQVSGLNAEVTTIATGLNHSCAIHQGRAKCWGGGHAGRLGWGSTLDSHTATHVVWDAPDDETDALVHFPSVTALSAGMRHTCAIHQGAAWCWGHGAYGQLGNGTSGNAKCYGSPPNPDCALTPVRVGALASRTTAISAGTFHTCAIHQGRAKCWGWGGDGQLGNGSTSPQYSPVQVRGLNSGVTTIHAGRYHTCAIVDEGLSASPAQGKQVKCWGKGALGNGTSSSRTPVDVSLPQNFAPAVLSTGHQAEGSCAITSGGRPECWGEGNTGLLGDGGSADRNTPGPVYDSSGF